MVDFEGEDLISTFDSLKYPGQHYRAIKKLGDGGQTYGVFAALLMKDK